MQSSTLSEALEAFTPLEIALAIGLIVAAIVLLVALRRNFRITAELEQLRADTDPAKIAERWAAHAKDLDNAARGLGKTASKIGIDYLQLLQTTVQAWRKASKWNDALKALQLLLRECVNFLSSPDLDPTTYTAAVKILKEGLQEYNETSRSAEESVSNGDAYLNELDVKLKSAAQSSDISTLRSLIGEQRSKLAQRKTNK